MMKKGDIVIHHDSVDKAIVLVSRVSGKPRPTVIERFGRYAGAKAGLHNGIGVPLRRIHIDVVPPITLDEIRRKQKSIFAIRQRLKKQFGDKGLRFPWVDYQGTLRPAQPYLNKVPRSILDLFSRLEKAVESLPRSCFTVDPESRRSESQQSLIGASRSSVCCERLTDSEGLSEPL
jgi:hypothetical protein